MIRANPELLDDRAPDNLDRVCAPRRQPVPAKRILAKAPENQAFSAPSPIPAWARASGRAGQGDPLFSAGAALAFLDAALRTDPPAAGALRSRLALKSAAACAKILRLNTDEVALLDLRFAVGHPLGPAATLLSLWRDSADRPPSLDPARIFDAAAWLDLALPDANGLVLSLKACPVHLPNEILCFQDHFRSEAGEGKTHGQTFEGGSDGEDLCDIIGAELSDDHRSVRKYGCQALRMETLDGVAHRHSAHAQDFGEILLPNRNASRQAAADNLVSEMSICDHFGVHLRSSPQFLYTSSRRQVCQ